MNNNKSHNELISISQITKLQKFSSTFIMLIVAIIMSLIGFLAIFKTVFFNLVINYASEKCFFKTDNIFLNLFFVILAITFLYYIYKYILPKINEKILIIGIIIFSLLLGLAWVNYIKFQPLSDQSMIVYCADCLLKNDLTTILEPGEYLNRNPHQLGCIVYVMAVFKIFNTRNPLILQILNTIYSSINVLLLYLICKEIFKENLIRKISLLLTAFFSFYWTFFNVHVYGNIPGLMFALLALLFTFKYLEKNNFYKLIITAISITFAHMLKSNYEIFLLAILIVLALHSLQNKKIESFIGIIVILISVFGFKSLVYNLMEIRTGYSLDTGVDMTAYVYMGIAEPVTLSPGWYTADVERIYNDSNFNTHTSKEISQKLLFERILYLLNNLNYTFDYFSSKLQTTWLNPTFQVFWCSTPSTMLEINAGYNNYIAPKKLLISILTGTAYKIEERIMDVYQIITFLSAGLGLFVLYKKSTLKEMLLPLTFLGGFIFHIIWETKSIYVIQYFYIMLPFAAFGLYQLFSKIDNIFRQKTQPASGAKKII